MKCNNCGEELVIPSGKKSGHCVNCGASFKADSESKQTFDDSVIDRIADRVVEKMGGKKKPAEGEGEGGESKGKKKGDDEDGEESSRWSD